MHVRIEQELCPGWSATGIAFRAYYADTGVPLYIGAETRDACRRQVVDSYPTATFDDEERR